MKRASVPRLTFHPNPATHQFYQLGSDRQTQASSTVPSCRGAVGLRECLEDDSLFFQRNADSGVADRKTHLNVAVGARLAAYPQYYFTMLGKFDGIADQIHYDLPETQWIAYQGVGHIWMDMTRQLDTFLVGTRSQDAQCVFERVAQIETGVVKSQLACLDLGEIKKIVNQRQQRVG